MALIRLDSKSLHMHVEVGILEEYAPDAEIQKLCEDIDTLKEKTMAYMIKLSGSKKSLNKLKDKLEKDSKMRKKWENYLKSKYNPILEEIIKRLRVKNEQICPGLKDVLKKQEESK